MRVLVQHLSKEDDSHDIKSIVHINGIKIDENGKARYSDFKQLSHEKRKAFLDKKIEYNKSCNPRLSSSSDIPSSSTQWIDDSTCSKIKKLKSTKINNLKKGFKESKGEQSEDSKDESNTM